VNIQSVLTNLAASSWGTGLRKVARASGLNHVVKQLFYSAKYEDEFQKAVSSCVREGDIIWDVGANVGVYTDIFLDAVGLRGRVVAFEPNPNACDVLERKHGASQQFYLPRVALGDEDSELLLSFSKEDSLDPTGSFFSEFADRNQLPVKVITPLQFVRDHPDLGPSFIKVDVEGFELAVLAGLRELFAITPHARVVAIEVHVGILQSQGVKNPLEDVKTVLKSFGYTISLTDPSHIIGVKEKMGD